MWRWSIGRGQRGSVLNAVFYEFHGHRVERVLFPSSVRDLLGSGLAPCEF